MPSFSYILRKTKDLVGTQCVKKYSGVNLSMVETMSENLIYADNVEEVYGSLGFDDAYIKAGIGWNLNQTNIVGMDPQLSYDVIYFKLGFSSSLYIPHAMETQRSNISSGH